MSKEKLLSVIRHSLTFIGGLAVMYGYAEQNVVNEAVGAVLTLFGVAWGIIQKDIK